MNMRPHVRHRREAPNAWAWWWRSAVTAYLPAMIAQDGIAIDVVGGDHGQVLNPTALPYSTSARRVPYLGRPSYQTLATAFGGDGRNRLIGGTRLAPKRITTQITVWWYGVWGSYQSSNSSPRLCALVSNDIDSPPYFVCGLSREGEEAIGWWNAGGYPNGLNVYTTGGGPDWRGHPLFFALTLDTAAGVMKLYKDGVLLATQTYYSNVAMDVTSGPARLMVHGHSTVSTAFVNGNWFGAGYLNAALNATQIARWAQDPMGPLTRDLSRFVPPAPRILRPTLDLGGSGWSAS